MQMRLLAPLLAGAAIVAATSSVVGAADGKSSDEQVQVDILAHRAIAVGEWDTDNIYQQTSWTARDMLYREVASEQGETVGDVEDIIIGPDGFVQAVIIESGGFFDIGDTHVRVPWNEFDVPMDHGEKPVVPVTNENIDEYDVGKGIAGEFKVVDEDRFRPRGWRANEIIGDHAVTSDGRYAGLIDDLVFNGDGKVEAVIIAARHIPSPPPNGEYIYPHYGYEGGFQPGYDRYELHLDSIELDELEPFDRDRIGNRSGS
jgi:sporulation protein YlmC with PRC-barrel domain